MHVFFLAVYIPVFGSVSAVLIYLMPYLCSFRHQQGYLVGNPKTGERIDESSKVPFAHGFGIISDQLYEVINLTCIHFSRQSAHTTIYVQYCCGRNINHSINFFHIQTILGHCQGQDYKNPTNVMCAKALGTFHSVRARRPVYFYLLCKYENKSTPI